MAAALQPGSFLGAVRPAACGGYWRKTGPGGRPDAGGAPAFRWQREQATRSGTFPQGGRRPAFADQRAGQLRRMTNRERDRPPRPGRQGPQRPSPKALHLTVAIACLLGAASGLVAFVVNRDPVAKWIGLASGLLVATAGISFFASVFAGRRRRRELARAERLRAVVTVVSALERRRRAQSGLDQGDIRQAR